MKRSLFAMILVMAFMSAQASGSGPGSGFLTGPCAYPEGEPLPGSGNVVHSNQYASLQAAVSAAQEGDTVLVYPGVYHETVWVKTPALRIRGLDRDDTILDGRVLNGDGDVIGYREIGMKIEAVERDDQGNIIAIHDVDRVVVENMTARYYSRHGFFWHHLTGYWGRYLTAYNNGTYGIYAFDARCGQFDHSYTSGNADSGFYIGECFPCDAVIHDIVAEQNALGYSGTNAGGNLTLRDSLWQDNGMGIVPNTLDGEERPPQRNATFKNNTVLRNNNRTAPGVGLAGTYFGVGIAVAGGMSNTVAGNTVLDHELAGIVLAPLPDENVWLPSGNSIWGNTVTHDPAEFPDSIDLAQGATSGPNNCWADNTFVTTAPPLIEDVWSCGFTMTPPGGDLRVEEGLVEGAVGLNGRDQGDWETWPEPTNPVAVEEMPGDSGAVDAWLPALGL